MFKVICIVLFIVVSIYLAYYAFIGALFLVIGAFIAGMVQGAWKSLFKVK
jgi:hypothetical protein